MKAVRAFYDFWNTGDEALLKEAIAPTFTDHTLPPDRPQGPQGPAFASRQFRAAVPDLKVTVEKLIVAGDYVIVHMSFTGHRIGVFADVDAVGRPFPDRLCMGAAGRGLRIRRVLGRHDRGVRCAGRRPGFGRQGTLAKQAGPAPLTQCRMEGPGELARQPFGFSPGAVSEQHILRAAAGVQFAPPV
jgi:predicted ester cyclase